MVLKKAKERLNGKPFQLNFASLADSDRGERFSFVSSTDVRNFKLLPTMRRVGSAEEFSVLHKDQEALIWNAPRPAAAVPDEERVENAGLNDDAERASTLAASDYV